MKKENILRHSGLKFRLHAKPQEINNTVAELPPTKRDSMYEVARELSGQGLIEILPQARQTEGQDDCL